MSPANYALRFATGFDGMMMVLSGMNDMAQMQDNLSFMKDFQPLSTKEQEAVKQVTEGGALIYVLLVVIVWKYVQRRLLFQIDLPV